jgi:NADH-quinone oxidoreductase subunit L
MIYAVCLALFLPLAGFLILSSMAWNVSRQVAVWIACTTVFLSFLCFAWLFLGYLNQESVSLSFFLFNWIPVEGMQADFTLRLDPLSLLMALIITGIGFLIHVYSIGYMDHDEDYARYFACLNLFVFTMLLLVLAANLLLLFMGWEGVGLASYLLIGFWYERSSAAKAASKAFIVNRIGDAGLLLGLLLTFYLFGTSDVVEVSERARQQFAVGAPILTVLTFLYFWGAVGKSAQLPLYVWLPDAMAGPTPVSALIHAATMVTAGVYLVVRMHDVFMLAPLTMHLIGIVGAVTALFASLSAIGQNDLKRVLAYSTVSQLGLMFVACGIGAFYAAMFHLTTHAFIKALLFLSAGNVIHMLHGKTDMREMGGLSKVFTKTHWLFLIGVLSLSGIPPLSAFFSKDLILEQEHLAGMETLFYIALIASILTAFYLMRAYCLTFKGPSQIEQKALENIKEAPSVMIWPLAVLAFLSILGGILGVAFNKVPLLEDFLDEIGIETIMDMLLSPETWLSVAGAIVGIGAAVYLYLRSGYREKPVLPILRQSFYIDEFYREAIVKPLESLARGMIRIVEPRFFGGSLYAIAQGVQGGARWLQKMQSGQIRSYAAWMVFGAVLLMAYFIF